MLNHRIPLRPSQLCRLGTLAPLARCCAPLACCVFALFVLLASAPSLSAQATGTISGHVADPTGAVIPAAAVTLTDEGTGTARSTVTTSSGDFTFPNVPPGTYSVEATHSGFNAAVSHHVELQIGQSLTQNFSLEVGAATQTVTVNAAGTLLQTDNTSLGTVVPTETVTQMPVNNRNILNLVAVSANTNVVSPDQGQGVSRLGGARASESISVGGSRIMFDHYTLDGINNSDPDFNTYIVQPSIDAIQEFKVQTGVYPAQYGYNATQVNVVSKSGTNNYHGTLFDFIRNNYADALGYDYNYPTPLPTVLPYKYNDYGFVLGGPIRIPHIFNGKNRFFFMVNDEWYSQVSFSETARTQPTAAELGGDMSAYTGSGTSVIPIFDPATGNADGTGRTQFPGNVIPASRIDPISQKFIQLYDAAAQTSSNSNNYTYLTQGRDDHDGFNVRGDFYQSAKSQFAFRFSNGSEVNPSAGFVTPGGTAGSKIITNYYQYMGSNTWTVSPTVVNVATFGYTKFYNGLGLYSQGTDDDVAKVGIPNLAPGLPSTWGIPSVNFTDDIFSGLGDSSDGPYVTTDPNTSISDNITWVHGKHSIDLGFEYERQVFNELGNQESRGNFSFLPNATAEVVTPGATVSGTGSAFADFLLGEIQQDVYAVSIAQANYVRNVEAAYIDDNIKLTPRLTFSPGLRYELTPPWYSTLGQEFIVDLETNNTPIDPQVSGPEPENVWPIFMREGQCANAYQGINITWTEGPNDPSNPNSPVIPGPECANGDYPSSLVATDYTNWAPRIGLSYAPSSTVVIRAGYGIFFDHDTANSRFDVARNLAGRVTLLSGGGAAGVATINWSNAIATGQGAVVPYPYSYSNQYANRTENTEEYLLDIQKQLGANWQFEAGYMGTLSHHLEGFRNPDYSIPYGELGVAGYYPAGVTSTTPGTTADRGTCTQTSVNMCGGPKSILDRSPYPNYEVIQLVHDIGIARYNAFSFQVNRRFSNGFNLISSYTYSKSLDDTSGIRTQSSRLFPQMDTCIICEYGPSDFDTRHRVVASLIYDLPIGAGRMWNPSSKALNAVMGGWEFTTLGTLQTGVPFNMSYNDDNAETNTIEGGTYPTRPNYIVGQPFILPNHTAGKSGQWVNLAAWQEPAGGFVGDTNRNMLYGPNYQDFDMSLDKNFVMPFNEHQSLQIRFDAFNALNRVNFGLPNSGLDGTSTPGQITGSNAAPGSANGGARELQLAARYTF
jgi:hypothetical protein